MNKGRRKEIDALIAKLEELKGEIEAVAGDERDYLENMPQNMQDGDKGQAATTAADALDNAATEIDTIVSSLEEARDV